MFKIELCVVYSRSYAAEEKIKSPVESPVEKSLRSFMVAFRSVQPHAAAASNILFGLCSQLEAVMYSLVLPRRCNELVSQHVPVIFSPALRGTSRLCEHII